MYVTFTRESLNLELFLLNNIHADGRVVRVVTTDAQRVR